MWVKELELVNFQGHANLKLEFTEGVNIIYGPTDIGKSCVRRALEWVCEGANIDGVRKTGTKMTSVRVTMENGVAIEKVRSASVNRYIIHKNGEEIVFDAVGKTIPEEVRAELRIEPIEIDGQQIYLNSAPQLGLPFLFDQSPSSRMKLFNKLTGNEVLDKLFVQFNKDILSINREHKREVAQAEEQAEALAELEIKKEKLEARQERIEDTIADVRTKGQRLSKLLELLNLVTTNHVTIRETERNLEVMKITELTDVKDLIEKCDRLATLKTLENAIEKADSLWGKADAQFGEINVPELNLGGLEAKIEKLDRLKKLAEGLDKCEEICYTLNQKVTTVSDKIVTTEAQVQEVRASVKICPTCGQEISEDSSK